MAAGGELQLGVRQPINADDRPPEPAAPSAPQYGLTPTSTCHRTHLAADSHPRRPAASAIVFHGRSARLAGEQQPIAPAYEYPRASTSHRSSSPPANDQPPIFAQISNPDGLKPITPPPPLSPTTATHAVQQRPPSPAAAPHSSQRPSPMAMMPHTRRPHTRRRAAQTTPANAQIPHGPPISSPTRPSTPQQRASLLLQQTRRLQIPGNMQPNLGGGQKSSRREESKAGTQRRSIAVRKEASG
ncbi:hypothetical protein ACLOJK_002639 [Asimina triloba]